MAETFGGLLRQLRRARGLSQRQLAIKYGLLQGKEFGATTSLIAGWEHGDRHPARRSVETLSQALKAAPEEHESLLIAAGYWPESEPDNLIDAVRLALRRSGDISPEDQQAVLGMVEEIQERRRKSTL